MDAMQETEQESKDTIKAIQDIRSDFRLRSAKMMMEMCGNIGDVIQVSSSMDKKHKKKLLECRNALISKVETIHENEQKDAEIANKLIRKNRRFRKVRFNEQELKMLEEVVELNNVNETDTTNKKNNSSKLNKISFIHRAGNDQIHRNYQEFVKEKQEEFNKNKSKLIAEYEAKQNCHPQTKRKSTTPQLPPITPRRLENRPSIQETQSREFGIGDGFERIDTDCNDNKLSKIVPTKEEEQRIRQRFFGVASAEETGSNMTTSTTSQRRFKLNGAMSLQSQKKELYQLKKMKLSDLNEHRSNQYVRSESDLYLPGQM